MDNIKIFNNEIMTIKGNIIDSSNNFIQINNITQVSHGRIEFKIPWFNLFLLTSISFWLMGTDIGFMPGILLFIGLVIYGFILYNKYNTFALNIELASGKIHSFTSKKFEFLEEAFKKLSEILEDNQMNKNVTFNFNDAFVKDVKGDVNITRGGDNSIVNSGDNASITKGNNSNIIKGNNNTINNEQKIDFEKMNKQLETLLAKCKEDSPEDKESFVIIEELMQASNNKDENKFKQKIKKVNMYLLELAKDLSLDLIVAYVVNKFVS